MRYVYLHGFASSPRSRKATAFERAFASRDINLEIPELDGGAFETLTISRQLGLLGDLLCGEPARLLGSSMGCYIAALYAQLNPEVDRLVLLAPAFGLSRRWKDLAGADRLADWKAKGHLDLFHYGAQQLRAVHYQLVTDSMRFAEFPDFRQPALIFHGRDDTVVPVSLSRTFAREHPEARLWEVDSDHELLSVINLVVCESLRFALTPSI